MSTDCEFPSIRGRRCQNLLKFPRDDPRRPAVIVSFLIASKCVRMAEILPVELLNENQGGRIVDVMGPTDWQHRLEELGLQTGQQVRLIRRGEPCIIAVQDHRLSLRCEPGTMILVEVDLLETSAASSS